MANLIKDSFLQELESRFGKLRRLENSHSLFGVGKSETRIYIRYSKKHSRNQMFYGLREIDLQMLGGYPSVLCFLWDGQLNPLIIPYSEYEEVFHSVSPATDGQYKVQIYEQHEGTELYIANAGRFNVESYFGWQALENLIDLSTSYIPDLSHSQVQTLLGAIGSHKGFDVWVPINDRSKLDWSFADTYQTNNILPPNLEQIVRIVEGVDVIWIERGAGIAKAFFEVEHSTSIYSGLLRFNDIHLVLPNLRTRFSVVSNDDRRSLFVRQLNRPTFKISGLSEICTFLEYGNVFMWHNRIKMKEGNFR